MQKDKMKQIDYDKIIEWLDDLTIEEIRSLLKSNIMDWDLRKKIRGLLKAKVIRKTIIAFLPVIATIAVASSVKDIVDEMINKM